MQLVGVPTSLDPNCSKLAGEQPVTSPGETADLLTILPYQLLLFDVSVTHIAANAYVAAASLTTGSVAGARAQKKFHNYALHEPGGYDLTPLVLESLGRQ